MDQKRVEAADEAFFAWATQTESRNANAPAKGTANKLSYGYEFVKQVMEIVLRAPKGSSADIPYSSRIVRHLLDKRCISSNMVPGGLLPALILRKDWVGSVNSTCVRLMHSSHGFFNVAIGADWAQSYH